MRSLKSATHFTQRLRHNKKSFISTPSQQRSFSLWHKTVEFWVGEQRAPETLQEFQAKKESYKAKWRQRDANYQAFRKDYPTVEIVLAAIASWVFFKLVLESAVNRYTDNTNILKAIAEHVDKQWDENYKLLSNLPAKESQAGFYLYTDPSQDKRKGHEQDEKAITYQLEKNQRLLQQIESLYPHFLRRLFSLTFKPKLADTLKVALQEQAEQLTIAKAMNQALMLYKKRRYDDANDLIKQTISELETYRLKQVQRSMPSWYTDKILASAYNAQGKLRRLLGDIPGAAAAYDKALQSNPEDAVIMSNKAILLSEESTLPTHKEALACHREAYRLDPHNLFVITNYGRGYYLQAQALQDSTQKEKCLNNALRHYDRALALKEDYVIALLYRGILWLEKDEPKKALVDFNKALEASPEHTSVLCRKAIGLAMTKQSPEESLKQLETALANKADWLKEVDVKLTQVNAIREALKAEPLTQETAQTCNQRCQEIARFFYQRPVKSHQASDGTSMPHSKSETSLRK